MAPLPELAAISKALNEESNRVNALLKSFEAKLCDLNFGVEGWVEESPLTSRELIETNENRYNEIIELYRFYDDQLGCFVCQRRPWSGSTGMPKRSWGLKSTSTNNEV